MGLGFITSTTILTIVTNITIGIITAGITMILLLTASPGLMLSQGFVFGVSGLGFRDTAPVTGNQLKNKMEYSMED